VRFCVSNIPATIDQSLRDEYPFQLMTVRSEGQFNTIIYEEVDSYRGTDNRWSVMMNGEDMRRLDLTEGDQADLRSPYGLMAAVQVYSFDLPAGINKSARG
jgi:anaerobic selenocysteine-containing dehydrogenase